MIASWDASLETGWGTYRPLNAELVFLFRNRKFASLLHLQNNQMTGKQGEASPSSGRGLDMKQWVSVLWWWQGIQVRKRMEPKLCWAFCGVKYFPRCFYF